MDAIKTVLIDDEELALATLSWQLEEFCPQLLIVETFSSPVEAYNFLQEHRDIQLCFLDIDMPEMSGFDFLKQWEGGPNFDIIFATAYNEFAIQAFKVSAFDYLLKPIDEDELVDTIQKYTAKQQHPEKIETKLELLYQHLHQETKEKYAKRISLSTREGIHLVEVAKIIRLEAFKNYTSVYTENKGVIVVSKTLKDVEQLIDPQLFLRVHQSHTINWNKVDSYQRGQGGALVLSNGDLIPVSKHKKNLVLDRLC